MNASLQLQKEIYTKLTDAYLRVYDFPPIESPYPFIQIGNDSQNGTDIKNGEHVKISSTILIFSEYKGKKETKELIEKVKKICETIDYFDEYQAVSIRVSNSFAVLDEKNEVTQGVLNLDFKIMKVTDEKTTNTQKIKLSNTNIPSIIANQMAVNFGETKEE